MQMVAMDILDYSQNQRLATATSRWMQIISSDGLRLMQSQTRRPLYTGLEVAVSLRNFSLTALRSLREMEVLCRPVRIPVGALFAPTKGLHFQAVHLISFLFICTLHCCKHCTRLEVAAILRKFPSTALCVDAGYGGIFRPVPVGAHFAPTTGLFF